MSARKQMFEFVLGRSRSPQQRKTVFETSFQRKPVKSLAETCCRMPRILSSENCLEYFLKVEF